METNKCSQTKFLTRLQELHFSLPEKNGTPSQRADCLRSITAHLRLGQAQGIIPVEAESNVLSAYEEDYGKIVDTLDEKNGLNNYAEGALAICSKHKNDSQKWKSSMSLEYIKSKDFYKKLKSQALTFSNSFLPPGCENDPVFKETSKVKTINSQSESAVRSSSPSLNSNQGQQFTLRQSNTNVKNVNLRDELPRKPAFSNSGWEERRSRTFQRETTPGWQSGGINCLGDDYGPRTGASAERGMNESEGFSRKRPLFSNGGGKGSYGNFGTSKGQPTLYKHVQHPPREPDPAPVFEEEDENMPSANNPFKTAKQQLAIDQQKKFGRGGGEGQVGTSSYGTGKKSLGTRRGPSSKFIPPIAGREDSGGSTSRGCGGGNKGGDSDEPVDERLKGIEPKMIELIMNEIMDHGPQLDWTDIAGLEFAKKTIKEIVVWPMLRPDIFTGLRGPPRGLLLFGPPGTGKTLIGKCIASQSKSTFFSISASSLTSKWVGEGEKMVRALFAVARCNQPAVVFIDEIDSLLSQRSDGEHEASRRIKTEFLVQLDGAGTQSEDHILVVGATNRPQEIDEAARRRFVKRLYIPLPDVAARRQIIDNLLSSQNYYLSDQDISTICQKTDGYSGADMANLCREAALGPVRSIPFDKIETITADQVPPITFQDFQEAFLQVRASVSQKDLDLYIDWNSMFGSFGKT